MTRRLALIALGGGLAAACGADASRAGAAQSEGPGSRRPRRDLYACEGCEGALERPVASLSSESRIAPPVEAGERMRIEGVVLQADGRTPARDVVVYAYHTDAGGLYSRGTVESEWSRRHGLLRGWIRTGADGRYAFDTVKPGAYPGERIPAHVHLTVLEPGRRPYWIDDIVFDGEYGVTDAYRGERENRGGNGIVRLSRRDGILVARRDIVLELHP